MKQVVRVIVMGLLVYSAAVIAMDKKKVSFSEDATSSEESAQPLTGRTPRDDSGSVVSMGSTSELPLLPQDNTGKDTGLPWGDARNKCERSLQALYDKAKFASNKLVDNAWTLHYQKYLNLFNAIVPDTKLVKVDCYIIGIQKDYFELKKRIEKKTGQNTFEMLVKTHPRSIVAAVSAATAVAVPMTYVASREVYKRLNADDDEDFGSDEDEKRLDQVCIDDCFDDSMIE